MDTFFYVCALVGSGSSKENKIKGKKALLGSPVFVMLSSFVIVVLTFS